ncbi:MAG: hypothetical protein U9N57_01160 [Pseudomonadota bacterium]|nr:hypothetical protein [Pseudomonadota bacterium]
MAQSNQQYSAASNVFTDPIIFWPLLVIALIIGVSYFKPEWIAIPWSWSVWINAHLLSLVTFDVVKQAEIDKVLSWLGRVDMKRISSEQYAYVNSVVGSPMRSLYVFLIALLMYLIYRKGKKYNFHLYTLEELIEQESKVWPHLKYLTKHNPLKKDWKEGVFAYRLSPVAWSRKNKVLIAGDDGFPQINQEKVYSLYLEQLGSPIKSKMDLLNESLGMKMVLVICFIRYDFGQNGAIKVGFFRSNFIDPIKRMLGIPILRTEDEWLFFYGDFMKKPDKEIEKETKWFESIVDEALEYHLENNPLTDYCFQRHAFATTFFIRAVLKAREYGILPCAWFPYLHELDKKLNYVLDDIRSADDIDGLTCSMDVAGVYGHFKAENKVGKRLEAPFIKKIKLQQALEERGIL